MKINGVEVTGPSEEILVLPRLDGNDLVFRAVAVRSMVDFDRLVPEPKAKARLEAGGWKKNLDDPDYQRQLMEYGELRYSWILLKSLEPSNIEWDSVDMTKPSTWPHWKNDLLDAGLCDTEINRIIGCVSTANCLNEAKLEAARESFLRGLAKASEKSSGQNSELKIMQSGEDVSG